MVYLYLKMDRPAERCEGGLFERLGEGGVRVDGGLDLHRQARLRDQVGGARPQDVDAEEAPTRLVRDDLDQPFRLVHRAGAAVRGKRELPDPQLLPGAARLLLRLADARDLRLR